MLKIMDTENPLRAFLNELDIDRRAMTYFQNNQEILNNIVLINLETISPAKLEDLKKLYEIIENLITGFILGKQGKIAPAFQQP